MDNYKIILATRDDRVVNDFGRISSNRAIKLDTATAHLPVQINKIFQKKGTSIEVLIVDLTLPSADINRLVFYIRQHNKDIPVLLLQMERTREPGLKEKEIFRNLSVYGWVRKPSNKAESLEMLEDFNAMFDLDMDKKFESARYLEQEDIFACTFKNGKAYFLNRKLIAEDDGSKVEKLSVSPDSYYFTVYLGTGKSYEIPWDLVLYYCEEKYQFHSSKVTTRVTAHEIGHKIKEARKKRRLTQLALEKKTGILRANIARIERGNHYPALETLERLAGALEIPVFSLLKSP